MRRSGPCSVCGQHALQLARMDAWPRASSAPRRVAIIGGGPGGYEAALAGGQLGAEVTLVERAGIGGSAVITDVVPVEDAHRDRRRRRRDRRRRPTSACSSSRRATDGKPLKPEVAINLAAVNKRLLGARAPAVRRHAQPTLRRSRRAHRAGEGRLDGRERGHRLDGQGRHRLRPHRGRHARDLGRRHAARCCPPPCPTASASSRGPSSTSSSRCPSTSSSSAPASPAPSSRRRTRALGAKVTLISSRDQVLPGEDADAASVIEKVFKRNGMKVLTKSRAESVVRDGDGGRRRRSPTGARSRAATA